MVKLTFLGTANAFGHDGRLFSCYLLRGHHTILIDAGPALFSALKGNDLSINDIDAIVLSHLHPDHYLGLPQIVLEDYYVIKRKTKIPVYGPEGTKEIINEITRVLYTKEVFNHVNDLFDFIEFKENETRELPGGKINTFTAQHSGNARMQVIYFEGKTIGYTGDTAYVKESYNELLKSDIVITEASSSGFSIPEHMTLEQIQELDIPEKCRVYLTHVGQSVVDKSTEIKHPIYLAEDNMTITV